MTCVLMTCFLMVGLSSLPDLDIQWEIKHRGTTHTFLFGIVVGALFSVLIGYAYGALSWLMGFIAGFGGTVSHLLGDIFTYSSFEPFRPFSDREIAFGWFHSPNKSVNNTVLGLGIFSFIISYEPSIFWLNLNSIKSILGS